jgi:DNA-binding FadR family transcriptional regulator
MADRSSKYRIRGLQGDIINALGSAIVNEKLRPGELLPSASDLIDQFSVGRSTVREAIRVLEAKGLVETRQKIGTRVKDRSAWNIFDTDVLAWHDVGRPDTNLLQDLIEARQIIEPAAARLAASRATLSDIKKITDAHALMCESVGDSEKFAMADVAFHMAVFDASHNIMLQRFSQSVGDFLSISFKIQQQSLGIREGVFEQDVVEHYAVLDAICKADGVAAEAAMLRVILSGKSALAQRLSHNLDLD